jgi:hypothetical protein
MGTITRFSSQLKFSVSKRTHSSFILLWKILLGIALGLARDRLSKMAQW